MTPNGTGCPMRPCGIATETGALAMLPRALICRAGVHLQDGRVLLGGVVDRRGRRHIDHETGRLPVANVVVAPTRDGVLRVGAKPGTEVPPVSNIGV